MDAVYILGTESIWGDNEELRYSIRSLVKNMTDLDKIFVVGHKPEWLQNVVHIECPDLNKHNKDANIIRKFLKACEHPDLSENFIGLSDDQLLLKPLSGVHIKPLYANDMRTRKAWGTNNWYKRLKNTRDKMLELNRTCFNFDTHTPSPYNKKLFVDVFKVLSDYDVDYGGYTLNSAYFNMVDGVPLIKDGEIKLTLEGNAWQLYKQPQLFKYEQDLRKLMSTRLYMGYSDSALSPTVKLLIQEKFPTKSRFEK